MSDGFFYLRDTRNGGKFRTISKPWMGSNTPYVEMTKEEYYGASAQPKKEPAPTVDNDDLMAGLNDGENSQ